MGHALHEHLGRTRVEQPTPRQTRALRHDVTQGVVGEVVRNSLGSLDEQPTCDRVLERADDLMIGAPADRTQQVRVDRSRHYGNDRENLCRGLRRCIDPRPDEPFHPGGATLGREQS